MHSSFGPDLRLSNSRTHTLLDEIKNNGLNGELVDFVWVDFIYLLTSRSVADESYAVSYVDEVQDMLLIDTRRMSGDLTPCDGALMWALVIISLCRNPDGLLWAGDTAQTISIGSTFTFKQLGASVYRYQVCKSVKLLNKVR